MFSAKKVNQNFFRGFFLKKNKLELIFKNNYNKRTQDLERGYIDAALFYLAKPPTWKKEKMIFSKNSKFIEINEYDSVDIDYPSDWIFAEKLYKMLKK